MRLKTHFAVLCLLVSVGAAQSSVKVSFTLKCAKPGEEHKIDVGPNHVFVLNQTKCSSEKPFEIKGVKSVNGVATASNEVEANKSRYHGYYVDTMENGDKGEYSYQGTGALKEGVMQAGEDSWTLVRGTGTLKGATGKGTCKGVGAADRSATWECVGEYTLASK